MPAGDPIPLIYKLKITLFGIRPPIWRGVRVPSTRPHDVLQTVLGWTNSHLHQFERGKNYWGVPQRDGFDDDTIEEKRVPLNALLPAEVIPSSTSTISVTIGGTMFSWRRSCLQMVQRYPSASPVNVGAPQRTSGDLLAIKISWM